MTGNKELAVENTPKGARASHVPGERLHAFDALRATAMFSVVVMHSLISYMTLRAPELLWVIYDQASHPFFDGLFLWIRGFTMPLFFITAGFWTARHYEKMKTGDFLRFRFKRLALPFLLGIVFVLPPTYYIWAGGWFVSSQCHFSEILLFKFSDEIKRNLYGPAHLWFLEYLVIFTAAYFMAQRARGSLPILSRTHALLRPGWVNRMILSRWNPLFLALPTAAVLYLNWEAMFSFRNTIVPDVFRCVHFGYFFLVGSLFYRFRDQLERYTHPRLWYLGFAILAYAATALLLERHLNSRLSGIPYFLLAGSSALFTWFLPLSFLGFFLRYFNRHQPVIRYFSDSSYWVYLIHFPIVGLFHLSLYFTDWPVGIKFLTALTGTLACCVLSYHAFVRNSVIGALLHRPFHRRDDPTYVFRPSLMLTTSVACLVLLGVLMGKGVHAYYLEREKDRYTQVITGFYRHYFNREPDEPGLRYWVMRALDHEGLDHVEQAGFVEAKTKGAE